MPKTVVTLLLLLVMHNSYCQKPYSDSLSKKKAVIDSLCRQINEDKSLNKKMMEGYTEHESGLNFVAYFYLTKSNSIVKIQFESGGLDEAYREYYYHEQKLVRVVSDDLVLYYLSNEFYDSNNELITTKLKRELIELQDALISQIRNPKRR